MSTSLLLLLVGCGTPLPPACVEMCAAAASLYGGCLEDWGGDWTMAGYADQEEFVDACQTWAWEMQQLEAHHGDEGWTEGTCAERAPTFAGGDCASFTGTDWNQMPWDATAQDP